MTKHSGTFYSCPLHKVDVSLFIQAEVFCAKCGRRLRQTSGLYEKDLDSAARGVKKTVEVGEVSSVGSPLNL